MIIYLKIAVGALYWLEVFTPGGYIAMDIDKPLDTCMEMAREWNKLEPNKPPAFCFPAHADYRNYIPKWDKKP